MLRAKTANSSAAQDVNGRTTDPSSPTVYNNGSHSDNRHINMSSPNGMDQASWMYVPKRSRHAPKAQIGGNAYACELTWDHWTELEKPAKSKSKAGKPNDTKGDEDAEEPKYVLRPVWHRGTFAMGQMMLGVGLSALILGAASRQVRRLYVIPTPKALQTAQAATGSLAKKSLIVQTVHHLRDRGKVIPMSLCTLRRGRNEKEVIVVPEGFTGTFWVDLEKDAKMWGKEDMSLWHMKQAMYQAFYGQQWAKVLNKHGWVQ
ncbi:hypothetical protein EUX98_g6372 [Antrodiella citrinella]|uniref:Uncharacterized protein n=1 Tax=Antrodiella citrinella TaxID=2447956 RepID=A0A4S4MP53_9APHY|nr:hypothetical protein EUX98_g6372 [Antrodiella citrinella]